MLSIDTQVLTLDGWKFYQELQKRDQVVGYDPESHTLSSGLIGEYKATDYRGIAYALQSEATDQIVSLSHACLLHERRHTTQKALLLPEQEYMPILIDNQNLLVTMQTWKVRVSAYIYLGSTYVSKMEIPYEDVMFSVLNETGYIVARRNDQMFVTGC
jgi:hypothetical protein